MLEVAVFLLRLFQAGRDSDVPAGNFQLLTRVTSLSPIILRETMLPGNWKSSNIIYSLLGGPVTSVDGVFHHLQGARIRPEIEFLYLDHTWNFVMVQFSNGS